LLVKKNNCLGSIRQLQLGALVPTARRNSIVGYEYWDEERVFRRLTALSLMEPLDNGAVIVTSGLFITTYSC
jgi:hypothetical protein